MKQHHFKAIITFFVVIKTDPCEYLFFLLTFLFAQCVYFTL